MNSNKDGIEMIFLNLSYMHVNLFVSILLNIQFVENEDISKSCQHLGSANYVIAAFT